MFSKILRRGLFTCRTTFCLTITVTICLLFVITTPLIGDDSDNLLESEKNDAFHALCQLPDGERQMVWGYMGSYRFSSDNVINGRRRIWWDSIDSFLSKAPDVEIVNFARIFTNPTVVAVLRQLAEHKKKSVADLAKECGILESEMEKTVEFLIAAALVARTEDNLIEPKNDAISFFLNLVSMTNVHLGHNKSDNLDLEKNRILTIDESLSTISRLPNNSEKPIRWGYMGAYRFSRKGEPKTHVAFWWDSIDSFLSKAPDAEIANLARIFTNPAAVAVLRQLMEHSKSVEDLAKGGGISESEIEKAVASLTDAALVARTEDNLIEPKDDAVPFFLNFVGMTIKKHLEDTKPEK